MRAQVEHHRDISPPSGPPSPGSSPNTQGSGTGTPGNDTVRILAHLGLHPGHHEELFWRRGCTSWVRAVDIAGAMGSIGNELMMLHLGGGPLVTFGSPAPLGGSATMWRMFNAALLAAAAVQLLLLLQRHSVVASGERSRVALAACNRLARVLLLWTFLQLAEGFNHGITGAPAAASAGGPECEAAAAAAGARAMSWKQLAQLAQLVLVPHACSLLHVLFLVPFRLALPLQLLLTAAHLSFVKRFSACRVLLPQFGLRDVVVRVCCVLHRAAFGLAGLMLGGWPGVFQQCSEQQTAAVCAIALESSVLLNAYAVVVLVLILPCAFIYNSELSMKLRQLGEGEQQQQRRQGALFEHRLPSFSGHVGNSILARTMLLVVVLLASFFLCESVVSRASGAWVCDSTTGELLLLQARAA